MYSKYHNMMIGLWAQAAFESQSVISQSCVTSLWIRFWRFIISIVMQAAVCPAGNSGVIWDEACTAAGWTHASVQCSCVSVNSSWGQTPPLFTLLPHPSTSQHAPCTACWERACRSCARTKENQGVWHCKGLGIHIWISFWSCYRLTWSPPVQVVSVTLTPSPTSAFKHCGCVSFFHTH